MKKLKKNDWLKYFIELLVVFIGVTAAFLLNNYREYSHLRRLETKFIESFQKDLDFDDLQLEKISQFNLERVDKIRALMSNPEKESLTLDAATRIMQDLLTNIRFNLKSLTYEMLKASASPDVISDFHLREELAAYFQAVSEALFAESIFYEFQKEYIIPFAYETMDLMQGEIISILSISDIKFRNMVAGWLALLEQNQEHCRILREKNAHLRILLQEKRLNY